MCTYVVDIMGLGRVFMGAGRMQQWSYSILITSLCYLLTFCTRVGKGKTEASVVGFIFEGTSDSIII